VKSPQNDADSTADYPTVYKAMLHPQMGTEKAFFLASHIMSNHCIGLRSAVFEPRMHPIYVNSSNVIIVLAK